MTEVLRNNKLCYHLIYMERPLLISFIEILYLSKIYFAQIYKKIPEKSEKFDFLNILVIRLLKPYQIRSAV